MKKDDIAARPGQPGHAEELDAITDLRDDLAEPGQESDDVIGSDGLPAWRQG